MKKIMIAVIALMAANTALAAANYTEQLREKYAGKNIYVEYVSTIAKAENNIFNNNQQVIHKERHRPERPNGQSDMRLKNKNTEENIEVPTVITGKYIYMQQNGNIYRQHDYPQYLSEDFPEMGVAGYMTQSKYRKLQRANNFLNNPVGGLFMGIFGDGQPKDNVNDVNILFENKLYFLDRENKKGKWCHVEDVDHSKKAMEYSLYSEAYLPNAIEDVINADPKKFQVKFINSEEQYIDGQKCVVETYSTQKLSLYGSPVGKVSKFDLFYCDGRLMYFSKLDLSTFLRKEKSNTNIRAVSGVRPELNRVELISSDVNASLFDVIKACELEQLPMN